VRTPLVVALLLATAAPADAGRTRFGWLYDSDVNPERGVELETWILEENGKGGADVQETLLWWGPVVGITDQLELAIPFEIRWEDDDDPAASRVDIVRFGAEARWRLVTSDPEEAPPLVPLLRFGVKRLVTERDAARLEADVVITYDAGRVHLDLDLGGVAEVRRGKDTLEARPGAGISVEVKTDLRVGLEAYAELGVRGDVVDWIAVGPNVAWTHGRFWLAASLPIGVLAIDSATRINTGIAF
jgi:hypothetical protein